MINYQPHFPYPAIRPEQKEAIEFAIEAFTNQEKRFVIVEAGTGVGKSAVGLTLAKTIASKAYFITTQKILQQQYVDDFSNHGMLSLKSSTNFRCKYYKAKDCSSALRELKVSKDPKFKACCGGGCIYKIAKRRFIDSPLGITNFAYFLAETNYSQQLEPRDLLIVDEAHNIETQIGNFVEVAITENFAKKVLKLKIPDNLTTMKRVVDWVKSAYLPELIRIRSHMEQQIEKFSLGSRMKEFVQLAKRFELIDKHECKVSRFLKEYDKDNWILNIAETEIRGDRRYEFKPIDVAPFTEEYLFKSGKKVLMMSATIVNKDAFCEVLGIKKEDCSFISIPSPFPIENRPILYSPMGSMSMKNIDRTLPKIAEAVKAILAQHKNEKGIIHCHSYKVAQYIKKNVRSNRLLAHNSENRDKVLWVHMNEKRPTVLLSPSMTEGVDLKGDASRFQIICKIPYPYLGDKLIRKRMNKWKWWYPLQTLKIIIQSVGRSVRTSDDQAITYILDQDWDRFYSRNRDLFPEDFKRCIVR
jgi:ATP-dependent DNA helicase DinG